MGLPWDTIFEEWAAPEWVPHVSQVLTKACYYMDSSPQVCSAYQEPVLAWGPHGQYLPSGCIHLFWR